MLIRTGDTVQVLTGADSGKQSRVMKVDRAAGKAIVENVARVYKHVRRSQKNPQGGRLSKEMPINISNVMLVCTSCNQATRTGARFRGDGTKERFCKSCSAALGVIAPPREGARAKASKT
jgi:large subunit ribosomal protein L24